MGISSFKPSQFQFSWPKLADESFKTFHGCVKNDYDRVLLILASGLTDTTSDAD
ncbi:hypothetical protein [Alicyclobacillus tolerans]|uniref:hypothetical protein n=1 Tax=Alicyclobacillus tolerans TaxID=90970 RepID=UPI001A977293|nr:hypothetical protein [Alicyclobacillus montanus]